jgi:hypothetical protein
MPFELQSKRPLISTFFQREKGLKAKQEESHR